MNLKNQILFQNLLVFVYNLVLLDVCHFHLRHQSFPQMGPLSRYSCLYLGSCIRELCQKKLLLLKQVFGLLNNETKNVPFQCYSHFFPKFFRMQLTSPSRHLHLLPPLGITLPDPSMGRKVDSTEKKICFLFCNLFTQLH